MQPGGSGSPGLRNSSPVENSATRNRRITVTSAKPSDAISPRSAGRSTRPAFSAGLPCARSSPRRRRFSPARSTPGCSFTTAPCSVQSSIGTTVSSPVGMTAPVMMRTHWPRAGTGPGAAPANTVSGRACSKVAAAGSRSAPCSA